MDQSQNNPHWVRVAQALIGTHEGVGPAINPVIIDWARQEGGWIERFYCDDEIPWCGLFVGHCLQVAGLAGPKNPLSALAWADWGQPLAPEALCVGAVLVFKRAGGGHVGFYMGEDPDRQALHVLGGNQADQVSVTRIRRDRLFAARWPDGLPLDGSGPQLEPLQVAFSQKES
jgi:uncharacterized protein (TIGR02594 family)